jgi:hypothetical protein
MCKFYLHELLVKMIYFCCTMPTSFTTYATLSLFSDEPLKAFETAFDFKAASLQGVHHFGCILIKTTFRELVLLTS